MALWDPLTPNSVSLWWGAGLGTSQMVKGSGVAFSIHPRGRGVLSAPSALRDAEAGGRVFPAPTSAVQRGQRSPQEAYSTCVNPCPSPGPEYRSHPGGLPKARELPLGFLEDARAPTFAFSNHGDDSGIFVLRVVVLGAGDTKPPRHKSGASLMGSRENIS